MTLKVARTTTTTSAATSECLCHCASGGHTRKQGEGVLTRERHGLSMKGCHVDATEGPRGKPLILRTEEGGWRGRVDEGVARRTI